MLLDFLEQLLQVSLNGGDIHKRVNMDKRKFRFISDLISCQKSMYSGKSKALEELYDLCDNEEKESLVKQLLVDVGA